jgi:ATP-dependent RNA helicase SUPV3L1/SUV3
LPGLVQAREADDHRALRALARNREVAELAINPGAVRLLWEVAQIPDFRKVMSESHARLLAHCFTHLAGPRERLPTDWIAGQIARLDRTDGDIDTLMSRIAHIRTWTYITHRGDWVEDPLSWQERARAIEDSLSDALHDRITERFVDRRSAFLARRLAGDGEIMAAVSAAGKVYVEGAFVGRLDGLRFVPDAIDGLEMRTLIGAANRVLRGEIAARARQLAVDGDEAFELDAAGMLRWHGGPVGRLTTSERLLMPRVEALAGDFIEGEVREKVRQRLQSFLRTEIERRLQPLFAMQRLELGGVGRGLVFQLVEALGYLPPAAVSHLVTALDAVDRKALNRLGLRFGGESVYVEPLLRPDAVRLRALLWAVQHGRTVPDLPPTRRLGKPFAADPALPPSFYAAIGRPVVGGLAVRPDQLERLAATAARLARRGPFAAGAELLALTGVDPVELRGLLTGLGYRAVPSAGEESFVGRRRRHRDSVPPTTGRTPSRDGHPFAKLRELNLA